MWGTETPSSSMSDLSVATCGHRSGRGHRCRRKSCSNACSNPGGIRRHVAAPGGLKHEPSEPKRPLATHPEPSATTVRDREAPGSNDETPITDSQDDSQVGGLLRTATDDYGFSVPTSDPARTFTHVYGRLPRGLQNRLRGAVEASRVSSILIHPRQLSRL